jgi:hypothetical protein
MLIIISLFIILLVVGAFLHSVWPKQEDIFFELGLLGKNKTADTYLTNDNSTVTVGLLNNWYVYVYNHMSAEQDVIVRVKLINSTAILPDDIKHLPSSSAIITQFPLSLPNNQTVVFPFWWQITNAQSGDNATSIKSLKINDESVQVSVSDQTSTFIIVMELWVKTANSGDYNYGWRANDGSFSASVLMGFKVAP